MFTFARSCNDNGWCISCRSVLLAGSCMILRLDAAEEVVEKIADRGMNDKIKPCQSADKWDRKP